MQFTGKNLQLVRSALGGAISDLRMHIGSCPEPDRPDYAEDIEEYEKEIRELERLAARIDARSTKP